MIVFFGTAAILMAAALFSAMGIYGPAAPASLIQPFGVGLSGPDARTEVRAVYGGFGIAMSVVLTVATVHPGDVATGSVTAVASALLGMAGGRLLARLMETPRTSIQAGSTSGSNSWSAASR